MPALIVGGCAGPLSTLDTAGPAARDIATLWWVMLGGAFILAFFTLGLLAWALRRRGREGNHRGSTGFWIGGLGLAMPSVVLLGLLIYALVIGERTIARPVPDAVVVEATGHQWFWTFRQPGASGAITTRNVLHIPAGRPVDVRIASADVIHSFWVPRLGGKMDAIPGQVNVLRIEASAPGVLEGQCAEFCGVGHTGNRFRVIVHDAAGWATFQRTAAR
ncbi:cytochrome c oxidase subunit II [Sphingomonas sp. 3-13AW]|uniref:cytochrome c oxidase subunit II n=1 Tax=Sphingomonas sp. 3-13AW TaxID=3050450 RepID=UPI003BB529E1